MVCLESWRRLGDDTAHLGEGDDFFGGRGNACLRGALNEEGCGACCLGAQEREFEDVARWMILPLGPEPFYFARRRSDFFVGRDFFLARGETLMRVPVSCFRARGRGDGLPGVVRCGAWPTFVGFVDFAGTGGFEGVETPPCEAECVRLSEDFSPRPAEPAG